MKVSNGTGSVGVSWYGSILHTEVRVASKIKDMMCIERRGYYTVHYFAVCT